MVTILHFPNYTRNACYLRRTTHTMTQCAENNCENSAAVRLHIPWTENREVCTAHARSLVQQDGVVAEPLDGAEENWR